MTIHNQTHEHKECDKEEEQHVPVKHHPQKSWFWPVSVAFSSLMIAGAWVYAARLNDTPRTVGTSLERGLQNSPTAEEQGVSEIDEEKVLPSAGVELPFTWGDLGAQLMRAGVIDGEKFEALYAQRGGLPQDMKALLYDADNGKVRMTNENAQVLLNIAWALGIGNKNEILEKGPMSDTQYGGAGNFASTGGWSLAKGDAMQHYSKHNFITLTAAQQALVEKTAKGIYRPCCGNSVHFPDCNHGMAMLGLLELMASQGVGEQDMMRAALVINSYWFPDTYLTIAKFLAQKGIAWDSVDPAQVLGANFSSSQGYQQILSQVGPAQSKGGGGCGV